MWQRSKRREGVAEANQSAQKIMTTTSNNTSRVWIVTRPSGVHLGRCLLGHGETKAKAIADAFGDRPPRRRDYTLEEIPEQDLWDKWYGPANA